MRILLLDIETSPNTVHCWGLFQQNVGINQILESSEVMCWAAKWHDEKEVMFMSNYDNSHTKMISVMHSLLDDADVVVHYNGKKFDMPTLNKEFLLHGYAPPSPYKQIDLLRVVRSQFKFPSNKLDYVAQRLGLGKKTKHEGHELWIKCMNKDPLAWKKMERYNKQDVVLLEKLYTSLLPWIKSHPNHNLYNDLEHSCPNCGSNKLHRRGNARTIGGVYQRFQCTDCGSWSQGTKSIKTVEVKGIAS
jgi:DNA polymerase elongation subunit (family B)/predicted RNA-binding Zn-ribbon protein involved in translation (DUF1610 family)